MSVAHAQPSILGDIKFTKTDSALVVDDAGEVVISWQANKPLIPASLTKLATAHLAIKKWGLGHRFNTDFFADGDTLWVKGYGDPFLVSEEIDQIVLELNRRFAEQAIAKITRLKIDNSHFNITAVPGRTKVADPYNAPLSAVSANFNTAKLKKNKQHITSAEAQTPLTDTARNMAHTMTKATERVNLVNDSNAQKNFAELLIAKLAWSNVEIQINQNLDAKAKLLYRHENSHTLGDVLRGTLEFSNNFMANQVFLKLAETDNDNGVSFKAASEFSNSELFREFGWRQHNISEGSGLSRKNRLSAAQIDELLFALEPNKLLFKNIDTNAKSATVYAKTGTLNGVRSYAGYIEISPKSIQEKAKNYRFVFNFNRSVDYRYRDKALEQLLKQLGNR